MSDDNNIEEMSPARRKMLAKLGKLPAAETSEPVAEPATATEVGDIEELGDVSPSRRKILAKLGRLPSPAASTAARPASAVAKPAPTRKAAARSATTGEDHPFVTGKIKRSVKPILDFKIERRGWLSMGLGWGAFLLGAVPAAATMFLRYLFPMFCLSHLNLSRLVILMSTLLELSMKPTKKNMESGLGERMITSTHYPLFVRI